MVPAVYAIAHCRRGHKRRVHNRQKIQIRSCHRKQATETLDCCACPRVHFDRVEILWRRESPRDRNEPVDKRNSPASPSPVSDGKSVFVFFGDYGLVSYGLDGNERWHTPLGPFNNVYGMGGSPILVDDVVVLVCDQSKDSFIAAFAQKDGKLRWKKARPEALSGH